MWCTKCEWTAGRDGMIYGAPLMSVEAVIAGARDERWNMAWAFRAVMDVSTSGHSTMVVKD